MLIPFSAWAIELGAKKWTVTLPVGSNGYYLNNNFDGPGVLIGQIQFGARQYDSSGNQLHLLATAGVMPGAKSLLRIGNYYYISNEVGGIARFDATGANAWSAASLVSVINPGEIGPESLATDGTYLYTNDDTTLNRIHAYTVSDPFGLTEAWSVDLPDGGRVRGLTYDPASGYLYMHNGGANGVTYNDLYAVNVSTHQAVKIGEHNENPVAYQALRYGNELLVFGNSDMMTAYSLPSDTSIGAMTKQLNLGLGDIYGAAIYGNTLFVTTANARLSAFDIIPEPSSLLLAGLAAAGLCFMWRRRQRASAQPSN
jgi:hypothetical protein